MAADIPTTEPLELRAGDTWKWTRSLADYPAGTWTLKYRFKNAAGGFEITAAQSGTDHAVTVAASASAAYAAGTYDWVSWVESGSEKYSVASGVLVVLADFRATAADVAHDGRSHARIVLDAIEAVIEGRASKDQEEYEIAGRRLKRTPIPTLLKLRQHYKAEVAAEDLARGIKAGTGSGRKIQFRL